MRYWFDRLRNEQHYIKGCTGKDSVSSAADRSLEYISILEKGIVIPGIPEPARIDSMCMRYRHDFGLLDEQAKDSLRTIMRQIYEEATGQGFFKNS